MREPKLPRHDNDHKATDEGEKGRETDDAKRMQGHTSKLRTERDHRCITIRTINSLG